MVDVLPFATICSDVLKSMALGSLTCRAALPQPQTAEQHLSQQNPFTIPQDVRRTQLDGRSKFAANDAEEMTT
jgi:hypothetical protein